MPNDQCDLIVRNAYVLTMNPQRDVFAPGAVAINGTSIVAVGPQNEILEQYRALREIDARGGIVHPGFVDGHYHTGVHLSRGALSDDPNKPPRGGDDGGPSAFARWFNALTDEDEYVSTLLAATEMLRCGITCFMEAGTALEPDAVAAAAKTAGIRAVVADPFLGSIRVSQRDLHRSGEQRKSLSGHGSAGSLGVTTPNQTTDLVTHDRVQGYRKAAEAQQDSQDCRFPVLP